MCGEGMRRRLAAGGHPLNLERDVRCRVGSAHGAGRAVKGRALVGVTPADEVRGHHDAPAAERPHVDIVERLNARHG